MLITAIEPRRKAMSALYLDGEFVMNLDAQTLIENRFDVGREIDDDELREIIRLSGERRAKEKALWLISYRSHSKKELSDKLRRTCDGQSAEAAAERMEELGLIDDREYARQFSRKLLFQKRMSKRHAVYELRQKGISQEIIDEVLEEIEIDPRDQIREVIEKKYRNIQDERIRRRAFAALQRLGHSGEDIRAVLAEYPEYSEDDGI